MSQSQTKFEFQAIGTGWVIDIYEDISKEKENLLLEKIMQRIAVFDKDYSRFRKDSLVTEMSMKAGEYTLPPDSEIMMYLYKKFFDVTEGAVTPLIGQVLVDAGYDAEYSLKQKPLHKPLNWDEVIIWQYPKLTLKSPALLDFGAGGKGYLVDIVSEVLEDNGIKSYCVDASGDMRHRSKDGKELRVGLEHPGNKNQVIGVAKIVNQSICGSAGNRRVWGDFHHIISPHTLSSPKHILAVWAIAESTILADLLTTALFFTEPQILLEHFKFDYLIVYDDYSIEKSDGVSLELFTDK